MRLCALIVALAFPAWAQWGGTLRFAVGGEPKVMHPWLAADGPSHAVAYLTSAGLIRIHRVTQKVEPGLAASWKWSDGGHTITFELRKGVRFSDGSPFTAEDVAASITQVADPGLASPHGNVLRVGGSPPVPKVLGPNRVAVRFAAPPAGWERLFADLAILPAQSARIERPAGLGPFVISSYKPGTGVVLARNPNYWRMGPGGRALPFADAVEISIQSNREIELLRFTRGELDFINKLDPDSYRRLAATHPKAARDLGPSLDPELLWFNQTDRLSPAYKATWFRSRNFRQAVSLAIRRPDLVRIAWQSLATVADGPVSPANKAWINPDLPPARVDLAAALRLLEKDGFRLTGSKLFDRAGHPVEFSLITNAGNATRQRMGTLIQQDLKALGMEVRLATLDFPSLVERISHTFAYDACLLGQNNVDPDPNGLMNIWLSSAPNNPWRPLQSTPSTPWEAEIDRLMQAQAATADSGARRKHFARVQEIARSEEPVIYLVYKNALAAVSERLANAQPALLYPQIFWNADELAVSPAAGSPSPTRLTSLR
jgi:peptide/nickel transport system substrate-binding protein